MARVLITTDAPKANMLCMPVPILPEHSWSRVSGKAATTTFQNPPPIVGSGPFQVVDAGTLTDYMWNYTGDTYTPDWDMAISYWTQDVDPDFIVDVFTPQQIEGWNDCLWTDPEYTALNEQQKRTIDPAARMPIIQGMQEIFYEGAAYAVLCYPNLLEAYNTADWEGWVPFPGEAPGDQSGSALFSFNNVDTYRFVHPVAAEEETGGGTSTALIVVLVVAGLAVVVVAALLLRRRGGAREEET